MNPSQMVPAYLRHLNREEREEAKKNFKKYITTCMRVLGPYLTKSELEKFRCNCRNLESGGRYLPDRIRQWTPWQILTRAFVWSDSQEQHKFWEDIALKMPTRGNEELPDE